MAIKIVRKSTMIIASSNHDTLINKDLANQHPISAISGLSTALDAKYEKPVGGIPNSDLASTPATEIYINGLVENINNELIALDYRIDELELGGGTGGVVSSRPWSFYYITVVDPGQTIPSRTINIPYPFVPNTNAIQVFEGALAMQPGENNDYIENNDNTITFNYDLPIGTTITVNGSNSGLFYIWKESFVTTNNQTDFSLVEEYQLNMDELIVFENGLLMNNGYDYEEIDIHTIRFNYELPSGMDVVICRRR